MAPSAILLYHRVAEPLTDPWWLAVSSRNFAAHLDVMRRHCEVVPLTSLSQRSEGSRPGIAITFDDGYRDNLVAAALLADRRLSATVFVVSTPLSHGAEFWWDQLDRIVLRTASLPDRLVLETENQIFSWAVPEFDSVREAADAPSTWRAWEPPRHDRQRLFLELYAVLFAATPDERGHLMEQLASWAATPTKGNDTPRALTMDEFLDLASAPGIEIGAHTQSHPRLADLPVAVQELEIDGSRRALEQLVTTRVSSFSYPFGRQSDYTDETVDLVRRASFELACSTVRGVVSAAPDRLQLPRLQVHDWEGTEFERWLMDSLSNGS